MVQKEKEKKNENPIKNLDELSKLYDSENFEILVNKIVESKQELSVFVNKIKSQIQDRQNELQNKDKEKVSVEKEKVKVEEKIEKEEVKTEKVVKTDNNEQEKENKQVQKTAPKPSSSKFEFKPKTENRNERDRNSRNNRFSNEESKTFSKNDKQNHNENKNFQHKNTNNDQKDRNNRNNSKENQNKLGNKDKNFETNRKNMPNKKPFEPKPAPITEKIIVKETDRQFGNKKKNHQSPQEKKQLSVRQQMRMGIIDNASDEDRQIYRRVKNKKKEEIEVVKPVISAITHAVITTENLTVKILSESIGKPSAEIIKKLFTLGMMCTINSNIDFDTAELIAADMGVTLEKKISESFEEKLKLEVEKETDVDSKFMQKRPPIVTVMGHVDHGKTSLLDAIRKTHVIDKEAGGITQHIGAYSVKTSSGESITFLDTPGHEAFTAMRERGAQVTDVAILIVAADDGVMPQTRESIRIIKEANIPMVVAINKIDKLGANIDRLITQLAECEVMLEEWGGDVPAVRISAKKGENISELLDMVTIVAEILELKANPVAKASGVVIESRLDKGLGPVATVIITNGTLKVGDSVASGTACGRIRALLDENGKKIKKAGPSTPVSILGLNTVPNAGDKMNVIDEKMLKQLVNERKSKKREELIVSKTVTKDNLFSTDKRNKVLSIIIKADVQGTAQAIKDAIEKIENEEVRIDILSAEVGAVTENDLLYATTSKNTMIICFNQKVNPKAKVIADREKIEIKDYSVIYKLIDDVTEKANSMMDPKYKEVPIGKAEVRAVFNLSTSGIIAGSYVLEGKIQRNAKCRVYRNKKLMIETDIIGLKYKKDDVKEIGVQFECGIKLNNFDEVQVGDIIDAYILERIN